VHLLPIDGHTQQQQQQQPMNGELYFITCEWRNGKKGLSSFIHSFIRRRMVIVDIQRPSSVCVPEKAIECVNPVVCVFFNWTQAAAISDDLLWADCCVC
jgi:hypothetical protein